MIVFNDREVIDIQVEGVSIKEYPNFYSAYVSSAIWADTKEYLTDAELVELYEEYPYLAHEIASHY